LKEREFCQIPQKSVNMAVIVQPFIHERTTGVKVHYNGVCITHDVARHMLKHGFSVNWYVLLMVLLIACYLRIISSFPGTDLRVTNHYQAKFPEQTILVLGREVNSIDMQLINTATGQTQSMVTQQDAEKMVQIFGNLHSTMLKKPHKLDDTVALDIEFMVVDNEHSKDKCEIVVLQARPYTVNVVHDEDLEATIKIFCKYNTYNEGSKKVYRWLAC
jgi:phosphoenolpyruvate synthase/pyruvate phosphate dikinase